MCWRRCCHVVSFTFTLSPEQIRCRPLSFPQVVGAGNFENSGDGGCVFWNHAPEIQQIGQSGSHDSRGPDQTGDVSVVASRLEVGFAEGSKPGSQPAAHPAVSVKSKLAGRRVLRLPGIGSQRNPRHTTPILATISHNARDLRLSASPNSATSQPAPLPTSRHPLPPQLSPLSDSHIAPGYHLFGPLRMSKNTQLRALSSFRKNEIRLRGDGGVRVEALT
ncbi:MAG: hypothetical protein RLZZ436_1241 [Planctomycetota bacterium]|jgi:hypothetical protein